LDSNIVVNRNGSTLQTGGTTPFPVYSTTVPETQYTGANVYQGDTLYFQSYGSSGTYPAPTSGTSTRTLRVTDDTGDIYPLASTSYGNSLAFSTSVVGGRRYRVYATTNYTYPTSATLVFDYLSQIPAVGGGYAYQIEGALSNIVDGDFWIEANSVMVNMYYGRYNCNYGADTSIFGGVTPNTKISRGYAKYGAQGIYLPTETPYDGVAMYDFQYGSVGISLDGSYFVPYSNGQTFTVGSTTVTVSLPTTCRRF
jgi:hypothetical protein